jgi:hypothetical protein
LQNVCRDAARQALAFLASSESSESSEVSADSWHVLQVEMPLEGQKSHFFK